MPISDSKRKSDRKWREKAYDKICLQYPKGFAISGNKKQLPGVCL